MRFVLKLGTSLLASGHKTLDSGFLQHLATQVAELYRAGHQIIIVSSGAVAAGRLEIAFKREKHNIPFRQALAAIGQAVLMQIYRDYFKAYSIPVAQALLTNYDFVNRENFLNTKNTLEFLLREGVIPVVNENDVTTIAELKFGDNDMLSARTAAMVSADALVILTDVDGLFEKDPKRYPSAKIVPVVAKIDDKVRSLAAGARSKHSLGGMITKLDAAEYVSSVGIDMFIANGRRKNILRQLAGFFLQCGGDEPKASEQFCSICTAGTFFPSSARHAESRKKWLKPKIKKNAWIEIDSGAMHALKEKGKSLLPSGITNIHGSFNRGDVVVVKAGKVAICYGQVNYGAEEFNKIKKRKSTDIQAILGFSYEEEAIHRDRMVILD